MDRICAESRKMHINHFVTAMWSLEIIDCLNVILEGVQFQKINNLRNELVAVLHIIPLEQVSKFYVRRFLLTFAYLCFALCLFSNSANCKWTNKHVSITCAVICNKIRRIINCFFQAMRQFCFCRLLHKWLYVISFWNTYELNQLKHCKLCNK